MSLADAVSSHCQFVWMSQTNVLVPVVLLRCHHPNYERQMYQYWMFRYALVTVYQRIVYTLPLMWSGILFHSVSCSTLQVLGSWFVAKDVY
jgi:hypothetical protein